MGIDDRTFWNLTPKTIQVYFKAYKEKRKIAIQDIWLQGKYIACAIASTLQFGKQKPPPYPEMPFQNEVEENEAHSEEWLAIQRKRAFDHFAAILGKNK